MHEEFVKVEEPNVHIQRAREMLKKYPQIRELYGPRPISSLWIILMVIAQLCLAYFFKDSSWLVIILAAYFLGAFVSHGLFTMIHEATHNLVARSRTANKVMGIVCDIPLVFAGAMAFRKYHMIHHRHLNEYEMDPDIVSYKEARLVGNSAIKKLIWISLFSVSQGLRPMRMKNVNLWNRWIIANLLSQLAVNITIFYLLGFKALAYLFISTFSALGPHPLGGRWLQEHYLTKEDQETYSYYGPINKIGFNIGYHNEHHDFLSIPWPHLPKLKKIAPEFYDNLKSYNSLTWVLYNFIMNPSMSPFRRTLHPGTHRKIKLEDS